jgi:signal recognition particle GTPase
MFDNLTDRLANSFKTLQGKSKLSESNIKDAIREVRRALLEADVALEVIKIFLEKVQEKALGLKVSEGLNPSQAFIKLVETELTEIIGYCFVGLCLSFFFWPLCCLSFSDLWILITPLVSLNSSYQIM